MIGVACSEVSDEQFRQKFQDSLREFGKVDVRSDEVMRSLQQQMYFVGRDGRSRPLCAARERLEQVGAEGVLYYLAIPPTAAQVEALGAAGLAGTPEKGWRRVIVEKPFGTDLGARRRSTRSCTSIAEEQIFRIDHYLGKETVQNLLALRFANGMFEPIWNRRYIEQVQITAAETVEVERRAAYYEKARCATWSRTTSCSSCRWWRWSRRRSSTRAACAIGRWTRCSPSSPWWATGAPGRGQGPVSRRMGERCRGARLSIRARRGPDSSTETFVALRFNLDSWRWAGVPFYLRTGKRLPKRMTEIAIQFHRPPLQIFKRVSPTPLPADLLVINVQPDEGISLRFNAKIPSTRMQVPVMMNFSLRHDLPGRSARGLRNASARRDAGRSHALRPS